MSTIGRHCTNFFLDSHFKNNNFNFHDAISICDRIECMAQHYKDCNSDVFKSKFVELILVPKVPSHALIGHFNFVPKLSWQFVFDLTNILTLIKHLHTLKSRLSNFLSDYL